MVGLADLLQREDSLADVDIEEALIHDALLKVSDGLAVAEEALLALVVPRDDELVLLVPALVSHVVEEASVLHDQDLLVGAGPAVLPAHLRALHRIYLFLINLSLYHRELIEKQGAQISLVLLLEEPLVPIHEDHEVISRQVQLECLARLVVEGHDADQFEGQVALQEVYGEVLVRHFARLAVDDAELLDRVLGDLVGILDWSAHVERDVDGADLVEQGEVLADLLPQLVL